MAMPFYLSKIIILSFRTHMVALRIYSRFCLQGSLLMVLMEPYVMVLGIKLGSALYKASTLTPYYFSCLLFYLLLEKDFSFYCWCNDLGIYICLTKWLTIFLWCSPGFSHSIAVLIESCTSLNCGA